MLEKSAFLSINPSSLSHNLLATEKYTVSLSLSLPPFPETQLIFHHMDAVQAPNIVAHITERLLYRRLIATGVDPEESMKVMAFWMWLEAQGFKELVRKISSNNDKFLALVADEAIAVLATLFPSPSSAPISHNLCPITSIFSGSLSIHDIFGNKETVSGGVADVYNRVCRALFKDVLEERSGKVEGDAVSVGTKLNPFAREWSPAIERVPEEERCLFLTFSKGNPITEDQIFNFFNQ
jgi:hypothetical protein